MQESLVEAASPKSWGIAGLWPCWQREERLDWSAGNAAGRPPGLSGTLRAGQLPGD